MNEWLLYIFHASFLRSTNIFNKFHINIIRQIFRQIFIWFCLRFVQFCRALFNFIEFYRILCCFSVFLLRFSQFCVFKKIFVGLVSSFLSKKFWVLLSSLRRKGNFLEFSEFVCGTKTYKKLHKYGFDSQKRVSGFSYWFLVEYVGTDGIFAGNLSLTMTSWH